VAGSFEHCHQPSRSIKFGELLDWPRNCYVLKKDYATITGAPKGGGGRCRAAAPQTPQNRNLINTDFVAIMMS
jgi:hypothetical protein